MILAGDVNLMNVTDPHAPFAQVSDVLSRADIRFANLECCFYEPAGARSLSDEGFYAPVSMAQALRVAGFDAVGTANNVNYGAEAIVSSLEALDGVGIAHTGSGVNSEAAHQPAYVTANGVKAAFVQRTSVYWPTNHEAGAHSPGVAALRGETAYRVPAHKYRRDIPPMNRPGVPPEVVTWTDPRYLQRLREDLTHGRKAADILVASHHWGLHQEVLQYMTEIAHAAIDSGADLVVGHGPHYSLPVEVYKGKPIFYGLGSFSFHTGHGGHKHGDWVGMLARVVVENGRTIEAAFRLVRHNERNETYFPDPQGERETVQDLSARSAAYGTELAVRGPEIVVRL